MLLGAFSKSFVMSSCPSVYPHRNNSAPTGQISIKIDVLGFFAKSSDKIQVVIVSDKNNGYFNHLTPNDHFSGRTAPLNSRCCIFVYSTNKSTEYFKHAVHSPFFSSSKCRLFHNATFYGSCIIHISNTECAKIKKKISGA